MSRLSGLGIAKRLSLIVATGAVLLAFANAAKASPASVRSRRGEIADRNNATDDELGALTDEVTATVAEEQQSMDRTVGSIRTLSLLVALIGLVVLIALAVPLARSIRRGGPHRRRTAPPGRHVPALTGRAVRRRSVRTRTAPTADRA